jgi:membrane-bound lytic murein transglycosylase A
LSSEPFRGVRSILLALFFLAVLASCTIRTEAQTLFPPAGAPPAPPVRRSALVPVPWDLLPGLEDDLDFPSLELAVRRSLDYYDRAGVGPVRVGAEGRSPAEMKESLRELLRILEGQGTPEEKRSRIAERFELYRASGLDGRGTVLFTGYYVPELMGSLVRTERFRHPVYAPPPEAKAAQTAAPAIVNRTPALLWSRKEIDADGALRDRGLEIAWVDDPTGLFFLHIQGSGKIRLPDGGILTVGYAGSNGRPFRSIGPFLAERGKIPAGNLSYRTIREYLDRNPQERQEILNWNERYIFFRALEGEPVGSLGVPVTAGRSIAVDAEFFPPGAAAFIRARKPVPDETGRIRWRPFSRFALAQDAGAAIKGPGRVDVFCGAGPEAERIAQSLKEKGDLYFLILRRPR